MSEKKSLKISMSTVFLIISIIVIILFAFYIYINNSNINKKINDLNNKILSQQSTINALEENNVALSLANNNVANQSALDNSTDNNIIEDDVSYEIVVKDEGNATINATLDGKTVSKDFEMNAMIDKTGTMFIPDIGNVAMISESGGESCVVNIYKLVDDEIESIGSIDCGADMEPDVDYVVSMKNDSTAVVKVNKKDENVFTKELDLPTSVDNVNVVDIFSYGKVILFSKSDVKLGSSLAYRLSSDYVTGDAVDILNAGTLNFDF